MIQKKYIILLAIAGLVICADQISKMYIHTSFRLGESVTIIESYFNITYVRNTGAAFGIFRDANIIFRNIFFLSMPPIAVTLILLMLRSVPDTDRIQILALSGIFGGALGNYIDRLKYGYVIDFLDVHIQHKYTWPAFNVADSAIVVGVCLLLFIMFKQSRQEHLQKKKQAKAT